MRLLFNSPSADRMNLNFVSLVYFYLSRKDHFVCKTKSESIESNLAFNIDLLIPMALRDRSADFSRMNSLSSHSDNSVSVDVATEDQSFFDCILSGAPLTTLPPLHFYSDEMADTALAPLPNSFSAHFVDDLNHFDDMMSASSLPLVPHDYYLLPPLNEVSFDHDIEYFSWDNNNISQDDVIVDAVPLNTADDASMIINPCSSSGDLEMKQRRSMRTSINNGRSKVGEIGLEEMKSYFYMPITRAAKEMNVGVTLLKKRCRELGIPRWPHRKMKSLNTLIHNVQELGKGSNKESIKRELESLEEHRRLMEENPELQLTERTKKLRQACFKANYKKRRAMQLPYSLIPIDHIPTN